VSVVQSVLLGCAGNGINQDLGHLDVSGSSIDGSAGGVVLVSGNHGVFNATSVNGHGAPAISASCSSGSTLQLAVIGGSLVSNGTSATSGALLVQSSGCSTNAAISHNSIDGRGSANGIYATGTGTTVWVGDNQITNTAVGITNASATAVNSYNTNMIDQATSQTAGTITTVGFK
jgi:hypothetical protein